MSKCPDLSAKILFFNSLLFDLLSLAALWNGIVYVGHHLGPLELLDQVVDVLDGVLDVFDTGSRDGDAASLVNFESCTMLLVLDLVGHAWMKLWFIAEIG